MFLTRALWNKPPVLDRPYPPTGLTSKLWRDVETYPVAIRGLVPTQLGLHEQVLCSTYESSFSLDLVPHVVEHLGVWYIEDGHHRLARALLLGKDTATVRIFKADR